MLFMKRAWWGGLESDPFKDAWRARATCRSLGLQVVPEGPSQLHTTNVCNPQPAADPHGGCLLAQGPPPAQVPRPKPWEPSWLSPSLTFTFNPTVNHAGSAYKINPEFGNFPLLLLLSPGPGYHHFSPGDVLVSLWAPYHELGLSTNYSPCGSQEAALLLNTLPGLLTALRIKSELHTVTPKTCRVWPYLPPLPHLLPPSALLTQPHRTSHSQTHQSLSCLGLCTYCLPMSFMWFASFSSFFQGIISLERSS